jgi:exonuclease III
MNVHVSVTPFQNHSMKFMTWNVDGLCGEATHDRTQKSLSIILSQSPDLVFLQEVIPQTERIFTAGLLAKGYLSATDAPPGASYFTMCYYNPMTVKPLGGGGSRVQFTGNARSRMVGEADQRVDCVHCV